uniref:Uncharacterized protein n=1 Tax=Nelumbo nucifera TaxID=4432 RepID=A0A822Z5R2_NELNU|nr:TPA_asm: hypothetical protein HUJ06_013334 [Nelumbo nucifera]
MDDFEDLGVRASRFSKPNLPCL